LLDKQHKYTVVNKRQLMGVLNILKNVQNKGLTIEKKLAKM